MKAGQTFFLIGEDSHLWMVVSDPAKDPAHILLVNFTSWQHIHDQTCVVQVGEHPWLKTRSVVYYPAPRIVSLAQLEQRIQYGLLSFHADLSPQLLRKIRVGALLSPFIPMAQARTAGGAAPSVSSVRTSWGMMTPP
jgi:hypothetical protein